MGNLFALIALLGWIPISAALFLWLSIPRALALTVTGGWLLLPFASYQFSGLPDFTKANVVLLGSVLGLALHKDSSRRLAEFRLSWIDLPAILLGSGIVATSLLNGLGIWDGVSACFTMFCVWIGPYLLARIAYRSLDDLRKLAEVVLWGGLFYVPLCLFEIRMSPQLHYMFYNFARVGVTSIRLGGYRPCVFLKTGLELGLWMTAVSLVGFILWKQGKLRKLCGYPFGPMLLILLVTTVLCKSTGALALLLMGLGCWWTAHVLRSNKPLMLLLLTSVAYLMVRGTGIYDGAEFVNFAKQVVGEERGGSFGFRLLNEDLLRAKAMQRPWFGWGGWNRSRVFSEDGRDIGVTDGRWIIIFGLYGVLGLCCTYAMMLLPGFLAIRRFGGQICCSEAAAPVAALTIVVAVFAIDCLLNDFPNPIYLLCAGALASVAQLAPAQLFQGEARASVAVPRLAARRRFWPPPTPSFPAKTES